VNRRQTLHRFHFDNDRVLDQQVEPIRGVEQHTFIGDRNDPLRDEPQLQSEFVAAVSHEFRSPLTTIRQMSEMLDMGRVPGDERRRAYYQVLAGEAARLQRLVETLLNFGRMEAGAARYTLVAADLASLVRRVVGELQPAARESGTHIEIDGPPGVLVNADQHALALALRNLIDNAIKYSPGQPVVRVEWGVTMGWPSCA
jgi:two-component system, OmpR family, phosphate regulon sensor histidine kinase PhoR